MIDYSLYLCTNSEMNNNYLLEDCDHELTNSCIIPFGILDL